MPTINPRQIFLTSMQSQNANGTFTGKNASAYTGGAVTSTSTMRMVIHPTTSFDGVPNRIPMFTHSVALNNGSGAQFVINESDINWFSATTGAFVSNSIFASNFGIAQVAGSELSIFDWFKATNPAVFDMPTSSSVNYAAVAVVYSSQDGALEFRNDVKTTDPIFSGIYSNPYAIGRSFTIPGVTATGKLIIKTTGVNNILSYEIALKLNGNNYSSVSCIVDASRNKIVNLLTTRQIYNKTAVLRTDAYNYARVT